MTGKELRVLREKKGLSQQKLGELLGYKERSAELTVQHWENDRRDIPVKHFRKLAEILDAPLEKFIP